MEGDHLRARGTTLGADDGMGCAYMLAILADDSLPHPYLECCFTTQEETGLVGAQALKPQYFKARRLINLDGAGEYKTYMSMAGGERVNLTKPLHREANDKPFYSLVINGLCGGHSGGMIDKEKANAGKLMARVLYALERNGADLRLIGFAGGTKHNVIMPRAEATFATDADEGVLLGWVEACGREIHDEYALSDPDICVKLARTEETGRTCAGDEAAAKALTRQDSQNLIKLIYLLPYGTMARNLAVEGNPPVTSVNIGVISVEGEEADIGISIRSSLECSVKELENQVTLLGELFGARAESSGYYPGWKYDADSPLREIMKEVFFDLYHEPLKCLVGHGGNECGVFKKMFPDMDVVTSGAIYGNIHTPDEFLDLASFDRSWTLLTSLIKAL